MGSIFRALSLIILWIMILSLSTGDTATFVLILSIYLSGFMLYLSFGGYKSLKVRHKINTMKRRIFKGKKYIPLAYAAELLGKKEDYIRNLDFSGSDYLQFCDHDTTVKKISKIQIDKKEFILIAETVIRNDSK